MGNIFYIYEWYNIETNEVFYVGKGKNDRYKTFKNRNKFFKNYFKTHKCDVRIIKNNLSEKDAFQEEINLIKYYRENYPNYRLTNQTNGGEGSAGLICSPETRKKLSDSMKGKPCPQRKQKKSTKGKKLSQDTKMKISNIISDKMDNEYKQKISNGVKLVGHITGPKISKALKGRVSHNKGQKMSEEQKRKIGEASKRNNNAQYLTKWEKGHIPYNKISKDIVNNIKTDLLNGLKVAEISNKYNVSGSFVYGIKRKIKIEI